MAVSGKTAAPWEEPYFLGTDKPPDMAAVTKALAEKTHANLATLSALLAKRQSKRESTGSIEASSSAIVTVTWPVAFADASYTVDVAVQLGLGSTAPALRIVRIDSVEKDKIKVIVANDSTGAKTGTIHATAWHD